MYTLGINATYHDPTACLVRDGQIIAAAENERFTHIKHGKRPIPFTTYEQPLHAIDYCLREAGIVRADVDHVAYSYDPYLLLGEHSRNPMLNRRRRSGNRSGIPYFCRQLSTLPGNWRPTLLIISRLGFGVSCIMVPTSGNS